MSQLVDALVNQTLKSRLGLYVYTQVWRVWDVTYAKWDLLKVTDSQYLASDIHDGSWASYCAFKLLQGESCCSQSERVYFAVKSRVLTKLRETPSLAEEGCFSYLSAMTGAHYAMYWAVVFGIWSHLYGDSEGLQHQEKRILNLIKSAESFRTSAARPSADSSVSALGSYTWGDLPLWTIASTEPCSIKETLALFKAWRASQPSVLIKVPLTKIQKGISKLEFVDLLLQVYMQSVLRDVRQALAAPVGLGALD